MRFIYNNKEGNTRTHIMAWNKPVTNTKPVVQTDEGPYGSTRAKSDDGRYTANPSYKGPEEEKELEVKKLDRQYPVVNSRTADKLLEKFQADENSYKFDKRITMPLFKGVLRLSKTLSSVIDTETFEVSTSAEDILLGIDVFAGSKSDKAYLLSDPNIHKIDIKTMKGSLGGNVEERDDFFKHPKLTIEVRRVNAYNSSEVQKPLERHQNTHFAFQIPYSEKSSYNVMPKDITKCKIYYMEHEVLNGIIANNCDESFIDKCCEHLKNNPKLYQVEAALSKIAHENGYDFKPADDDENIGWEIERPLSSDPTQKYKIWFGRKIQEDNQKWQIRVSFPSTLCAHRDDITRVMI